MRNIYTYGLFLVLGAFLIAPVLSQNTRYSSSVAVASKIQKDMYGDQLGTVRFPMSCSVAAKPQVERGVALLHHMTYNGARAAFSAATQTDSDCAMGYWGHAMTHRIAGKLHRNVLTHLPAGFPVNNRNPTILCPETAI